MARVRSRTSSAEGRRSAITLACALFALLVARLGRAEVEIAPSPDGHFGAWLVAGPVASSAAEAISWSGVEPRYQGKLAPSLASRFRLAAVADGALDVRKLFGNQKPSGAYAF